MNDDLILKLSGIFKSFNYPVLDDISFTIKRGEVVSLTGLNGAGKTTLIKIILGLIKPDAGTVNLSLNVKQQVGVILQDVSLPDDMKVFEWLKLINIFSKNKTNNLDLLLDLVDLKKYKAALCSTLSGGNKRKLQFAVSITNNPQLLILDEPTTGLDYKAKKDFWVLVQKMVKEKNLTVLVITHDLNEVENFTDRILILDHQKLITDREVRPLIKKLSKQGKITVKTENNLSFLDNKDIITINRSDTQKWIITTKDIDAIVTILLDKKIPYRKITIQEERLSDFFESEVEHNYD